MVRIDSGQLNAFLETQLDTQLDTEYEQRNDTLWFKKSKPLRRQGLSVTSFGKWLNNMMS